MNTKSPPVNALKTRNISFGPDVFRCVLLFFTICDFIYIPWIKNLYDAFAYNTLIYWGFALLICDFLYKRSFLKMKNAWIFIAILVLNAVSLMPFIPHWLKGNLPFFWIAVIFLTVICPPDSTVPIKSKYRAIFAFSLIIIIPTTILSAMSLWAYVTDIGYISIGEESYRIIRGVRLPGYYIGPNIAGMLSLLSISSLIITWTLLKTIFDKPWIIITGKLLITVLLPLQMIMLTLCDSMSARFSLLVFILLFSFTALYRYFYGKLKSVLIRSTAAIMAAITLTGAVYMADQPIRVGMAILQTAVNSDSAVYQPPRPIHMELSVIPRIEPISKTAETYNVAVSFLPDIELEDLNIIGRDSDVLDSRSATVRFQYWKLGFEAIERRPFFGSSPRRFQRELLFANNRRPDEEQINFGKSMHNAYIQLAVTSGIPVLLLYLLYFILFAKRNLKMLFKSTRSSSFLPVGSITALCASLAFWNMFESDLFFIISTVAVVFWSGLSFSASLLQYQNAPEGSS